MYKELKHVVESDEYLECTGNLSTQGPFEELGRHAKKRSGSQESPN